MRTRQPPPSVRFKDGWPRTYSDEDLDHIVDSAAGAFIHAGVEANRVRPEKAVDVVVYWGEVLDLAHGEIQRRALRSAGRQARWALIFAGTSTLLAAIVGIAQIAIALSD